MNRIITVNDLVKLKACAAGLKWFAKHFPDGLEMQQTLIIHEGDDCDDVDGYINWFYNNIIGNKSCDSSSQEVFYTCKYGLQNGDWKTHEYNEAGLIIRYEDSDGYWQTCEYNKAGKVLRTDDSNGDWKTHEYNEAGQETRFERSDGSWKTRQYNEGGQKTLY